MTNKTKKRKILVETTVASHLSAEQVSREQIIAAFKKHIHSDKMVAVIVGG